MHDPSSDAQRMPGPLALRARLDALTTEAQATEASEPSVDAQVVLPLRATRDLQRLEAWALVLSSRGVRPHIQFSDGFFELYVAPYDRAAASAELAAHDAEELETQRAARADAALERRPVAGYSALGSALMMLALLAFFALTGPRADGSVWFFAGASDAERVLHGELWRTVTALTLHADTAHVMSNVGIGVFVIGAVMRSEGVGLGSLLVLASGAAGNLLNAWAHQSQHKSVGFSTAVFGAIGILGGLAYVHSRMRMRKVRPAWTALGGALALLAMLGASERSDLFAHLFGALAGVGLGLAAAHFAWRPKTWAGQWFAAMTAAAVVVGAWSIALA